MHIELSKREKKLARELIEKGVREEFKRGMLSFDAILQQWKNEDIKENYYKIFNAVTDFDKQIARRYDGMTGSKYLLIVAGQVYDKLYDRAEIDEFGEEAKDRILRMLSFADE
jgi:hypothetical protein